MKKITFIVFLLLVGGVAGGVAWWRLKMPQDQQRRLTLYGNVDIRSAQLAFDGEAIVATMQAEEGTPVKAGEILATLDSTGLQAELDEGKAQVLAQDAVVRRLEAGTRKQEIEQARAHFASVQARLANAEQDLKRITETAASGASSQQRLDEAHTQVSIEKAQLAEAEQVLSLANDGPRQEDIEEARARLQANRAHVRLLENRLANTSLRAPFAGVIRSRLMEPGDYATRGRAAYTLAMSDPKWVRGYVSEPDLGRVRPGARAWVTSDSFKNKTFDGWVGFISPVAEFTPKTVETTDLRTQLVYEVRIYVKDPEDRLRLGMPTTVVVDEASSPSTLPVPTTQSDSAGTGLEGKRP